MVTLYVGGREVRWADAEAVFAAAARTEAVEFRDAAGNVIATTAPPVESDPDWVKTINPEETARRMAEPGLTFDELKKRLAWE
jgi:hypothetical protein